MAEGAVDVCMIPVTMKKGRPGIILRAMAKPQDADRIEKLIFQELPTLGIRRQLLERTVLNREETSLKTELGAVSGKLIAEPDGTERIEVEFAEKIRLAAETGKPVRKLKL
jgi:uncharacterized protein (DUF111 family)